MEMRTEEVFVRFYHSPLNQASTLHLHTPLAELCDSPTAFRDLLHFFRDERYVLQITAPASSSSSPLDWLHRHQLHVHLLFREEATPEDVLAGFLHATKLRLRLNELLGNDFDSWQAAFRSLPRETADTPPDANPADNDSCASQDEAAEARRVCEILSAERRVQSAQQPRSSSAPHASTNVSASDGNTVSQSPTDTDDREDSYAPPLTAALFRETLKWTQQNKVRFVHLLKEEGWQTQHLLLEGHRVRFRVVMNS